MKMDHNHLDQSPPYSDNNCESWVQCWNADESSVSGLNFENSHGLRGLVEDKEIAARAVAFVVNNTRKGIVPLCADVATLLLARKSLEKKVATLRAENHSLRSRFSSTQTSISTSPAPTSIHSYSEHAVCLHDNGSQSQDKCSICSHSSSCNSSLASNSPKLDKAQPNQPLHRTHQKSAFTIPALSSTRSNNTHEWKGDNAEKVTREQVQVHSLPEIVCQPGCGVQKIRPKISRAASDVPPSNGLPQGAPDVPSSNGLPDGFQDVLTENKKLSAELMVAQKEIKKLKKRLKELEMTDMVKEQLQRHQTIQHHQSQDVQSDDKDIYKLENGHESPSTVPSCAITIDAVPSPACDNGVLDRYSEPVASVFSQPERTAEVNTNSSRSESHPTEANTITNSSDSRPSEGNTVLSRSESKCHTAEGNTEGNTISSRSSRPPVLARRDHRFHSQRLVNEKHFVMMGESNGRILAKEVVTGHHGQTV